MKRTLLSIATCAPLLAPASVLATDGTWTNLAGGLSSWINTANWQDGIVANGTDAIATFNGDFVNQIQINAGTFTVGTINLTDTGGGTDRGIRFDAGSSATFDTTVGTPTINVLNDGANDIPIQFNNGTYAGNVGLILNVPNTVNGSRFSGSAANWSGFNGALTLQAGRYQTEGANVLPDHNEIIVGNGVQLRAVFNNTRDQRIRGLSGGNATSFVGANDNASATGTLTLGFNSVGGDTYDFSGSLGGDAFTAGQANNNFSVTKTGPSTQKLSGNNIYTGTTTVNGGTLLVNGTHTQGAGANAGRYVIQSTGTLGGTGTINLSDTSAGLTGLSVAGTLAPGDGGIGTLTLNGLNSVRSALALETGGTLLFDLGAALTADTLAILNAQANEIFFNNNTINFNDLTAGSLASGAYLLFDLDANSGYSGLTTDGSGFITSGLSIGSGLGAYTASLQVSGQDLYLNIAAVPEPTSLALLGVGALIVGTLRRRTSH